MRKRGPLTRPRHRRNLNEPCTKCGSQPGDECETLRWKWGKKGVMGGRGKYVRTGQTTRPHMTR